MVGSKIQRGMTGKCGGLGKAGGSQNMGRPHDHVLRMCYPSSILNTSLCPPHLPSPHLPNPHSSTGQVLPFDLDSPEVQVGLFVQEDQEDPRKERKNFKAERGGCHQRALCGLQGSVTFKCNISSGVCVCSHTRTHKLQPKCGGQGTTLWELVLFFPG